MTELLQDVHLAPCQRLHHSVGLRGLAWNRMVAALVACHEGRLQPAEVHRWSFSGHECRYHACHRRAKVDNGPDEVTAASVRQRSLQGRKAARLITARIPSERLEREDVHES